MDNLTVVAGLAAFTIIHVGVHALAALAGGAVLGRMQNKSIAVTLGAVIVWTVGFITGANLH